VNSVRSITAATLVILALATGNRCPLAAQPARTDTATRSADAPEDPIGDALARDGHATVVVTLDDGLGPSATHARTTLAERKAAYRRCQDACVAALADSSRATVRYRFRYSPVLVVDLADSVSYHALAAHGGVRRVDLDGEGHGALDESRPMVGADRVHDLGVTGTGRLVAILDSGVDSDHPDITDAILHVHAIHFLEQGKDVGPGAEDGHGHGTNVTGIVASRGSVAPLGIAPGSSVLPIKVLDDNNRGWFSDWAAGLDHAVFLHEEDNGVDIDVINMSLASNSRFSGVCDDAHDAIRRAVDAARELGITIFAASGNSGSTTSMSLPACMSATFSVGSVFDTLPDRISRFTNRNALLDILAPGETILSTGLSGGTSSIAGTSQATPHCAALACLLLEIEPGLTPEAILDVLQRTGVPVFDELTRRSYSRIDAFAAVASLILGRVEGLACRYEASSRSVVATWDSLAGPLAGLALHVALSRGDEEVAASDLPADRVRHEWSHVAGGSYDVAVTVVRDGQGGMTERCASVVPDADESFRRGDCNADRVFDVADAVFGLRLLFQDGAEIVPCLRACDANDDAVINVTDPIFGLRALFQGGVEPPPPYPSCGVEPARPAPILACLESTCA